MELVCYERIFFLFELYEIEMYVTSNGALSFQYYLCDQSRTIRYFFIYVYADYSIQKKVKISST